jgi:small-conductance mechanosensitive channel
MDFFARLQEELTRLVDSVTVALPRVVLGLIIFLIGFLAMRLIQRAAVRAIQRTPAGLAVERLVSRAIAIVGITLSTLTALATMGVDVGAALAALGLGTLAIGLALKDTIENTITGVLLLIQRPFQVGDLIKVGETLGTVTDVAIRTTNIRTLDGLHVLIPNRLVYNEVITNWSYYPTRRITATVGVAYDTDLSKAYRVLKEAIVSTPGVLADPAPLISFEAFDANSIRMVFRFWINWQATNPTDAQTDVTQAIMDAARREGIPIPFPIRTVHVEHPAHVSAVENTTTQSA